MTFLTKNFHNFYNIIRSSNVINKTQLHKNIRLSNLYNCNVFFKREDLQTVRSFKIRGAYAKIKNSIKTGDETIVTVSAGNHAQGVSLTCNSLKLKHHIFLPENTPYQKINRIKYFGQEYLNLHIVGNNFDESLEKANEFCKENESIFVHPFDDNDVILGQSTVAQEIYDDIEPDIIVAGIGGGGLISGVGSYSKLINDKCLIYGVEPENANAMQLSLKYNKLYKLDDIDTFVDGASVKIPGKHTFEICKKVVDDIYTISNNHLCNDMIDVYQNDGIILEPAGCLSISALDKISKETMKDKNVVCILSGGNNDCSRYSEIMEKSLLFNNLKHYYLIKFSQRPGELKRYMNNVLTKTDDITRFEYLKKTNKDYGTVLLGIEIAKPSDITNIENKMNSMNFDYIKIMENDLLYSYLL